MSNNVFPTVYRVIKNQPPPILSIELDHNPFKCQVPGCSKSFRKASLLHYHMKYYHSESELCSSHSTHTHTAEPQAQDSHTHPSETPRRRRTVSASLGKHSVWVSVRIGMASTRHNNKDFSNNFIISKQEIILIYIKSCHSFIFNSVCVSYSVSLLYTDTPSPLSDSKSSHTPSPHTANGVHRQRSSSHCERSKENQHTNRTLHDDRDWVTMETGIGVQPPLHICCCT